MKTLHLDKFEILSYCKLSEDNIKDIRKEVEIEVRSANKYLLAGADYGSNRQVHHHEDRLGGIRRVCSIVGIAFDINLREVN